MQLRAAVDIADRSTFVVGAILAGDAVVDISDHVGLIVIGICIVTEIIDRVRAPRRPRTPPDHAA